MLRAGESLKVKPKIPIAQQAITGEITTQPSATVIGIKRAFEEDKSDKVYDKQGQEVTEESLAKKPKIEAKDKEKPEEGYPFSLFSGYGSSSDEEKSGEEDKSIISNKPGLK